MWKRTFVETEQKHAPFLKKMIRLCSMYLRLASLKHPQREPWTCHKETMRFRNKKASGVSGSTLASRWLTAHIWNQSPLRSLRLSQSVRRENSISITGNNIFKLGKRRKFSRKFFFTKSCVAYGPWAKGKEIENKQKPTRPSENIWDLFSIQNMVDPSRDMHAVCYLFNPGRIIILKVILLLFLDKALCPGEYSYAQVTYETYLVKPTYTWFKPLEIYRHCEEL